MDIHSKLTPLDYAVIVGYIIALLIIGFRASYRRRDADDLFLGGRSQGWGIVGLSIFGTNVNPSFLISSCSVAYATGIAAANFEWLAWWLMMLLAMVFVPFYWHTRVSTMPEFINRRFGNGCYNFLSYYSLFTTLISWLGAVLYTGGVLFSQIVGWPLWVSLVFLTSIAASFTIFGGLVAVMVTDAFQTILMILGAATLTIIGLIEVGGVDELINRVPDSYWQLIRPADDPDYPWHAMVLGFPVLGIWFWCTDQTIVQRVLGARDMKNAQLGIILAAFLKILPPFLFLLPGILCFVLHPELDDPDKAFATMVVHHLPSGMVGLIVAVLIAALISTLDSGLNSFSTIFTLDIYQKNLRPSATPQEIKWIGRLTTAVVSVIAVGCALMMESFERGLFDTLQSIIAFIAPPVAAVFLMGILWRGATSTAALVALWIGSLASISLGFCHLNGWPTSSYWPHYLLMSFYVFAGICLLILVVSLVTEKDESLQPLPSLKQLVLLPETQKRTVWVLWGLLAAIMGGIYILFS